MGPSTAGERDSRMPARVDRDIEAGAVLSVELTPTPSISEVKCACTPVDGGGGGGAASNWLEAVVAVRFPASGGGGMEGVNE